MHSVSAARWHTAEGCLYHASTPGGGASGARTRLPPASPLGLHRHSPGPALSPTHPRMHPPIHPPITTTTTTTAPGATPTPLTRKSKMSVRAMAVAMSLRCSVRRLVSSAAFHARSVSSRMKNSQAWGRKKWGVPVCAFRMRVAWCEPAAAGGLNAAACSKRSRHRASTMPWSQGGSTETGGGGEWARRQLGKQ